MVENPSDQYGRALEYIIVEKIVERMPHGKIKLTARALRDQERDKEKLSTLPHSLLGDYLDCAEKLFIWLVDNFSMNNKNVLLDRLTDQDARAGDVTDIKLTFDSEILNLSIKHRHDAVKHQRPPSTAQWCGYKKGGIEDIQFRQDYNRVISDFLRKAYILVPGARNFRDVKAVDQDFINNYLYQPVCRLVCDFINANCVSSYNSAHLFSYLVGSTDYYKVINSGRENSIYKFKDIPTVTSVTAQCSGVSYIELPFSNKWQLSMRIHTAASALGADIKFDTRATNLEDIVPREQI